MIGSIDLDVGLANNRSRAIDIGLDLGGIFRWRAGDRGEPEHREAFLRLRPGHELRIRRARRSTIGGGVPAGATRPITSSVSWPARPLSAMVGTSGAMGERCALVTANARSVPSLMKGVAGGSPI